MVGTVLANLCRRNGQRGQVVEVRQVPLLVHQGEEWCMEAQKFLMLKTF